MLNAANEIAVEAFLDHRLRFVDIPAIIETTLESVGGGDFSTLDGLINLDQEARQVASSVVSRFSV